MLLQMDLHASTDRISLHHQFCRFVDQIILIRRQFTGICGYHDPTVCSLKVQHIIDSYSLHDHLHFMVTILQSSDHIQPQIDLGIRFYPIFVHFCLQYVRALFQNYMPLNSVYTIIVLNFIQSCVFCQWSVVLSMDFSTVFL